ncbi:hypothetical protein [Muricoccus pecuniae]|uniref:Putative PurR-regulated permease PerM n=1 Tax=Muricoccus pecuniae TaxID=693023 RepID=A0A840XYE6_9PROT|nr:hypothetical protein [Roseomonas pecuniae]MBB5692916.1 putative PurR-regulated permease PerM [Roseomonas pecuniae]
MIKTSLLIMTVLTVLIAMLLSWRERRMAVARPAPPARGARRGRAPGLIARGKAGIDRWMTAAAIAALLTIAVLGGLHWLRVFQQ